MSKLTDYSYYIFPKRCAVCSRVISHKNMLCSECENKIKRIESRVCVRCGLPKSKCECNRYAYHFRGVVSPFLNQDAARDAVYGFKFAKNYDASDFLAKEMARIVREQFSDIDFDCVTAVPMHWHKKYLTGYDHAKLLAVKTARELNLPFRKLLIKKRKNKTQHTLSAKERFSNVKNAYAARKNNYKNVLLIDDIKTTGATLDECARRLMFSGTDNVYCATAVIGSCKTEKG